MHSPLIIGKLPPLFVVVAILFACAGCSTELNHEMVLRMAVTTSTRDSGLLDVLVPPFEEKHNVRVDVIALGTGAALKLGKSRDVDVVLVHARESEDAFMEAGHGVRREDAMVNSFLIVGPPEDPAEISQLPPGQALLAIAESGQKFVSRGDDSGTHQRELNLWRAVEEKPAWDSYLESGQGMGATLTMANQLSAYVLVDQGTYLHFKEKIALVPLVSESPELDNPYGIIVVRLEKTENQSSQLAHGFVNYIISRKTQELIRDYRVNGKQLFRPLHFFAENSE